MDLFLTEATGTIKIVLVALSDFFLNSGGFTKHFLQ